MKSIRLGVPVGQHVILRLGEIIREAPRRFVRSSWSVSRFEMDGYSVEIDALGENYEQQLQVLAERHVRLDFGQLQALTELEEQTIWASFFGFDVPNGSKPWICMSAVDSTYWRLDTNDIQVREWIFASFGYAEECER